MDESRKKFWMVYREGGNSPIKKHFDVKEAEAEAMRVTIKTGKPAYVLESMCGFEVPQPEVTQFNTEFF